MLCAIAEIESDRRPLAYRFEPALGEASTGLMQVLQSTAEWLARDMGYRAYTVNWASEQLYRPFAAVYFGGGAARSGSSSYHLFGNGQRLDSRVFVQDTSANYKRTFLTPSQL